MARHNFRSHISLYIEREKAPMLCIHIVRFGDKVLMLLRGGQSGNCICVKVLISLQLQHERGIRVNLGLLFNKT